MKTTIKNITLAVVLSGVLSISGMAQAEKQIKQLEKYALKAFRKQDYKNALAMYLQLDNMSADQTRYDYMIGMCYLSSDAPEKALAYLRTGKDHPTTSWVVDYYLGRAYFNEGNFIEAGNYLASYKEELNYLLEEGFRFKKVDLSKVPDAHRVHYEKTLEDVNKLLAICAAKTEDQMNSFVNVK